MKQAAKYLLNSWDLEEGDIVLTSGHGLFSWLIKRFTHCNFSHAAIYVGNGSLLESTNRYSFSKNIQRLAFDKPNMVVVLRLKDGLTVPEKQELVRFVREKVGARYSVPLAVSSVLGNLGRWVRNVLGAGIPRFLSGSQYCSHYVAEGYSKIGIVLSDRGVNCTPGDLFRSKELVHLENIVHVANVGEMEILAKKDCVSENKKRMSKWLNKTRLLGVALGIYISDINDVRQFLLRHRSLDHLVVGWILLSKYHSIYRNDLKANPCRYFRGSLMGLGLSTNELKSFVMYEWNVGYNNANRHLEEYLTYSRLYGESGLMYDRVQRLIYRGLVLQTITSLKMLYSLSAQLQIGGVNFLGVINMFYQMLHMGDMLAGQ